jgi:H+/Cl- antiporter ClcA
MTDAAATPGAPTPRPMVVLPVGLTAAGIGSLVSIGPGSWGGLSSEDFAIGNRVRADDRQGRRRGAVLRPGAASGLVEGAGTRSVAALALLIAFKSAGWGVSLGGFRGGPTFPGLYLGAAVGVLASHLPRLALTPAVAVGMGAATVAVLRLPVSAVLLATVLTSGAGAGVEPFVIVGVAAAFLTDARADQARRAPGRRRRHGGRRPLTVLHPIGVMKRRRVCDVIA